MFANIYNGRRVLVTGHTGFKGSWLTTWLLKLGAEVVGVSRNVPTQPAMFEVLALAGRIRHIQADIRDLDVMRDIIAKERPDFIFHLAAQAIVSTSYSNPVETMTTNVLGTMNVLEALRTVDRPCVAVLITSDKCYNNVEWVWGYRETDGLGGKDIYSGSKGAAELVIKSYLHSFFQDGHPIRLAIGRAGNVIGGGDWASDRIVPDCVRSWSAGEAVQLRNPHATRPWQHVLEPLSGYLTLAMSLSTDEKMHGEPFNFGPPAQQNHSVGELVSSMSRHWDRVRYEDVSTRKDGHYESGLLKLNCDKALHHLRWHAVWDFEATVRETALWYRRYYEAPQSSITEFSLQQIDAYVNQAEKQGLAWVK